MTETLSGTVTVVKAVTLGDILASSVSIGAGSLTVEDAAYFSEAGGTLRIGGDDPAAQILAYTTTDPATAIITLASTVAAAWPAAAPVDMWDPATSKPFVEYRALVELPGSVDNADVLDCVIAHALIPLLPQGIRDPGEGESVTVTSDGGEWTVTDILGRTPSFDGGRITPATITPLQVTFTTSGKDVTIGNTAPASPHTGDLWYDGNNGYQLNQWSGSAWVPFQFGTDAIAAGSITADLVAANAIVAGAIAAGALDAQTITAGTLHAGSMDGTIGSSAMVNSAISDSDFVVDDTGGRLLLYTVTGATVVTFTTAGASTWTVPAGITSVKVETWGGSAGGYGCPAAGTSGAGGGGGEYAREDNYTVTPAAVIPYTVGAGGAGGTYTNLLAANDASFETSTTGWNLWANLLSFNRVTSQSLAGAASAEMKSLAAGSMFVWCTNSVPSVTPGSAYSAYASFKAAVNSRSVQVGIEWRDAGGTAIYTSWGSGSLDTTSGWTYVNVNAAVAPATAATARVVVAVIGAAGANEIHYLDAVGLLAGSLDLVGGNGGDTTFDTAGVVAHGALSLAGGSGSTNTVHFSGGWGGLAGTAGSGGGSSAGPNQNGKPGQRVPSGTTGGLGGAAVTDGGAGGAGGNSGGTGAAGSAGSAPGGGGGSAGSGSAAHTGGAGAAGKIRLTYGGTRTLIGSIAGVAGTDAYSNAYPAGAQVLLGLNSSSTAASTTTTTEVKDTNVGDLAFTAIPAATYRVKYRARANTSLAPSDIDFRIRDSGSASSPTNTSTLLAGATLNLQGIVGQLICEAEVTGLSAGTHTIAGFYVRAGGSGNIKPDQSTGQLRTLTVERIA